MRRGIFHCLVRGLSDYGWIPWPCSIASFLSAPHWKPAPQSPSPICSPPHVRPPLSLAHEPTGIRGSRVVSHNQRHSRETDCTATFNRMEPRYSILFAKENRITSFFHLAEYSALARVGPTSSREESLGPAKQTAYTGNAAP